VRRAHARLRPAQLPDAHPDGVAAIRRSLAALAIIPLLAALPSRALAADPPAGLSTDPLPAWWASPGSPGWTPDAAFSGGLPWVAAGLAYGGFALRDPVAPATLPLPGLPEAQAPLAWYDSATVVVGEGAGWRGFDAALVTGTGILVPPASRKPRSVWTVVNGSNAIDENGLFVSRGDRRSWLHGGAIARTRGGLGDLDLAGNHLWTAGVGARRGPFVIEGGFAQRGVADRERRGFGEAGRGETGWGAVGWTDSTSRVSVRFTRGQDMRELLDTDFPVMYARHDAQVNIGELSATTRRGETEYGLRVEGREGLVSGWFVARPVADRWRERSVWVAARMARPLGAGRLEAALGAGRHDAPERQAERLQAAPSVTWRIAKDGRSLRLFGERIVNPVWSDLAPGTPAFVQDTWVGGIEARAGGSAAGAGLSVAGGTTGNRAVLLRHPILALAELFPGWVREATRYSFTLAQADARAGGGPVGVEASGYLLARQGDSAQPRVDPSVGGLAAVRSRFRLFTGDLGVGLRAQVAWIGPRATDRTAFGNVSDVSLPGYATVSAIAHLTLGDATFVLRADGLEDVRHEETWPASIDTPDVLARDAGRTFRLEMTWPLFN